MAERYVPGAALPGREQALALGDLSRAARRIRRFDARKHWLDAGGLDPKGELETLRQEHKAALAARAATLAQPSSNTVSGGCPTWVPTDDLPTRSGPFKPPANSLVFGFTGYAPFTATDGVNEFPPGAAPLGSYTGSTAVFVGRVFDEGGTTHWYRDWRFRAALPPAPSDGHFDYRFVLSGSAWWYATTVSLDGWLQVFFTTLKPPFDATDALCDTAFLADLAWPGEDELGQTGTSVRISGRLNVLAGETATVAFNGHVYTGVSGGEMSVRGALTPVGDRWPRPSEPWPPEHLGEVFYHFVPRQVIT